MIREGVNLPFQASIAYSQRNHSFHQLSDNDDSKFFNMPPAITNNIFSPQPAIEAGPTSNLNEVDDLKVQISNLEKEVTTLKDKYAAMEKRLDKYESQLLPNELSKLLMREQSGIS